MARGDVKFIVSDGNLGRVPEGEDHVSAILIPLSASPVAWSDSLGKKYLGLSGAESDGIVESDAIYQLLHYQIKEFFRIANAAELWIINLNDSNYNSQNLFALTEGSLRQIYYAAEVDYTGLASAVTTVKALIDAMNALYSPLVAVMSVKDETTVVDGTAQPDLTTLNAQEITVLISGDGSGTGQALATSLGVKYIPAGGAVLGALARAQVHENIGWVREFNLISGAELQKVVVSDAVNYNSLSAATLQTLCDKGYMVLRKIVGINGTYVNDTITATLGTSDYSTLENNRTIQKAKRNIRISLLPELNSPLTVDASNGQLSPDTVKYFENLASAPLTAMQNVGELSGFGVFVDPSQNVLGTSLLCIEVSLLPRGVARNIVVKIGFAVNANF